MLEQRADTHWSEVDAAADRNAGFVADRPWLAGVSTLKTEQARIATDIRSAEERLAAVDAYLAEWQEILEIAMRFATNCAKAYARAAVPTRRRFNQAVFTRIDVRDGKIADVGYHPPFDLLFSTSEFEYGDLVGRTRQHANRDVLVDGNPLPIRLIRSRARRRPCRHAPQEPERQQNMPSRAQIGR